MFGMVKVSPVTLKGEAAGEAYLSPIGLEIRDSPGDCPGQGMVINAEGAGIYTEEASDEIRRRWERAMEERSPILYVSGGMGERGADRDREPDDFYLRIEDIQSVCTQDGVVCIPTTHFTVCTRHHTVTDLGDQWRMKLALLGASRT